MTDGMSRLLVVATLVAALLVPSVAEAAKPKRRGGKIERAWPADKSKPRPSKPLVRWLAQQVGPVQKTSRKKAKKASAAQAGSAQKLLLVRSFDIPTSDPAYGRLENVSFTYDSALATFAFLSAGVKTQAEQLLDQLKALQRTDGSIEYSFNVNTGTSASSIRAGAMAWVGYAALAYREVYNSTRYDTLIAGVARYLLALRDNTGLVKGGPDVSWVSTQHNLLTAGFLRDLAANLGSKGTLGSGLTYTDVNNAANSIGNAILANLIVQEGALAYFRQGIGDQKIPADVQALGAMYLDARGDGRARQVAEYLRQRFYVAPRGSSAGTLSGFRPYFGTGTPDLVWSEGTIEAAEAFDRVNIDQTAATVALTSLLGTIKGVTGPAGASADYADTNWGEYHTWPTSAAGSWLLIRASKKALLFAH